MDCTIFTEFIKQVDNDKNATNKQKYSNIIGVYWRTNNNDDEDGIELPRPLGTKYLRFVLPWDADCGFLGVVA